MEGDVLFEKKKKKVGATRIAYVIAQLFITLNHAHGIKS